MSELTSLRDQLKAGLLATAHDSGDETGPSVSDLADRIKALKAAHSIEAAPQRARPKHISAQEPVTARIRKRQDANAEAREAVQAEGELGAGKTSTTGPAENPSDKPPLTFRQRITLERDDDGRNPA